MVVAERRLASIDRPLFGVVALQDSLAAVTDGRGANDELVRYDYAGSALLETVAPGLTACETPYTYSARPSGSRGLSVAFACLPSGSGPLGEVVYSADGVERTLAVALDQPPSDHSWDVARRHVWVSYSSRVCATIAIVDVDTGQSRQPDLVLNGSRVSLEPIESMTSGRGCDANSAIVDHASISPDGRLVALSVNTQAMGQEAAARLNKPTELVVLQVEDHAVVFRATFDEIHEIAWSPDNDQLAVVGRRDQRAGLLVTTTRDPELVPSMVLPDYTGPVTWGVDPETLIIAPLEPDGEASSVMELQIGRTEQSNRGG